MHIRQTPGWAVCLGGKLSDKVADSESFIDDILYNARVFITPGSVFGSNGDRFIRISLGSSEEKIQEAYHRINAYLSTLQ